MTYEEFISEWNNESESVRCFSSGSTGKPKEIFLPKVQMRKSAERTMAFFRLGKASHLHSCISPDYIGGKMMAVRSLITDCRFSYEKPSNRPLSEHDGTDIDLISIVPSQMLHILDNITELPNISNILIGGAPVNYKLRESIAASGLNAWESYGMTETSSHIALRHINGNESGFRTLPGISVSLDQDSRLCIDIEGWQKIVTNDVAQIHANGTFSILGRSDNVIISGGKKIHPEEIESKLESRFGVSVMAAGIPDQKWGEKMVLIIEDSVNDANHVCIDKEVYDYCRREMNKECIPKEIVHAIIPRTPNGKPCREKSLLMAEIFQRLKLKSLS